VKEKTIQRKQQRETRGSETSVYEKMHHCPLCNYNIKLIQKGTARKITNTPKQFKAKI